MSSVFKRIRQCYCYNDECNQKEWERQGKTGKKQYTVVEAIYDMNDKKVPKCPWCKKKMTVTANLGFDGDLEVKSNGLTPAFEAGERNLIVGSNPITSAMEDKVEKIWNQMFDNYISPSRFEKLFEKWDFHEVFATKVHNMPIKEFIKKCLDEGLKVKAGWTATSIKDVHDHHILTRRKK